MADAEDSTVQRGERIKFAPEGIVWTVIDTDTQDIICAWQDRVMPVRRDRYVKERARMRKEYPV